MYQKEYRHKDRPHYLALRRAEYERRRDKIREYARLNAEHLREYARGRRAAMTPEERDDIRIRHRVAANGYRERNPELCNARIKEWKERNSTAASDYTNRRRARARSGPVERIDRVSIGERDGWVCGICDEPVDQTLKFPDRMSPSLDHILPLSRGGHHVGGNVRI